MHSVYVDEVGLHSPLTAELQLVVCVICAAYFSAAPRDCTNHLHLPTCKAKANDLGLWLRNQDYLHVLYASQVALSYTVLKPKYKQASLRNSSCSLIERGVESLGNLNESCTVRNTRGLPFNASYACTGMHRFSHATFFLLILPNTTNHSMTQPEGELLLGLPTLLTTHHVNAEKDTNAKQPQALKQSYGEL